MNTPKILIDGAKPLDNIKAIAESVNKIQAKSLSGPERIRISRKLLIAKQTDYLTIVCEVSGIVSLMELPAIPGYALSYEHPIALLENARGIAQQGIDYLRKLEVQTLAGILIVLANSYDLLHYQPADSGAQKNAILRTVGKDCLINAILVIENMVHSGNYLYLPKLSLIMDTELFQNELQSRIENWLKLLVEAIYKPDLERYDEDETIFSKQQKQKQIETRKSRKELIETKVDCRKAKNAIKDLLKQQKISVKLSQFLIMAFKETSLLTMETTMKVMLASKLEDITGPEAALLIKILKAKRENKIALEENDFFEDSPIASFKQTFKQQATIDKNNERKESFAERIARIKAEKNAESNLRSFANNSLDNDPIINSIDASVPAILKASNDLDDLVEQNDILDENEDNDENDSVSEAEKTEYLEDPLEFEAYDKGEDYDSL